MSPEDAAYIKFKASRGDFLEKKLPTHQGRDECKKQTIAQDGIHGTDWQWGETGVEPPPVATPSVSWTEAANHHAWTPPPEIQPDFPGVDMEGKAVIDCEQKQDWGVIAMERYDCARAGSDAHWQAIFAKAILAELCRLNANLERKP